MLVISTSWSHDYYQACSLVKWFLWILSFANIWKFLASNCWIIHTLRNLGRYVIAIASNYFYFVLRTFLCCDLQMIQSTRGCLWRLWSQHACGMHACKWRLIDRYRHDVSPAYGESHSKKTTDAKMYPICCYKNVCIIYIHVQYMYKIAMDMRACM